MKNKNLTASDLENKIKNLENDRDKIIELCVEISDKLSDLTIYIETIKCEHNISSCNYNDEFNKHLSECNDLLLQYETIHKFYTDKISKLEELLLELDKEKEIYCDNKNKIKEYNDMFKYFSISLDKHKDIYYSYTDKNNNCSGKEYKNSERNMIEDITDDMLYKTIHNLFFKK